MSDYEQRAHGHARSVLGAANSTDPDVGIPGKQTMTEPDASGWDGQPYTKPSLFRAGPIPWPNEPAGSRGAVQRGQASNVAAVDRASARALKGNLEPPSVQYNHGNALGDKGLGCRDAPPGTDGCVLTKEQRTTYLSMYLERVGNAKSSFLDALGELQVEELLKKEPERSEWMMELLLDVIGHVAISAVIKAVNASRSRVTRRLVTGAENASNIPTGMNAESDPHLPAALGMIGGLGKKAATNNEPDPAKRDEGTQKAANMAYLSYLEGRAESIYATLRESVPVGLSDSLFLALFDAFEDGNHTVAVYKRELQGKLKRFEMSGVGKLGVTKNADSHPLDHGPWRHETRAFWVKTPMGRRLGLYQREHRPIPDTVMVGSVRRVATPFDKVAMEMQDFGARSYTFVRYVPVEFEAAAVAMHVAKWHTDPVERVAQAPEEISFAGVTV
jgi:hypothetical protein